MTPSELEQVKTYVNENIVDFHESRLRKIQAITLLGILKRKNPYLFRAKNLLLVHELVPSLLDAYLSSSEEEGFGQFLEGLAIHVSSITCGGQKSSAPGLDLELTRDDVKYIVAIKSGPNWGNSGQYANLKINFARAVGVLRQNKRTQRVQPVLGICYGKTRDIDNGYYRKICGQAFWNFISGEPSLYIDLIEPIGYEAEAHNENYKHERAAIYNRFIMEFTQDFCFPSGEIDWPALLKFNSGNLSETPDPEPIGDIESDSELVG